jgi:hypothetical protein
MDIYGRQEKDPHYFKKIFCALFAKVTAPPGYFSVLFLVFSASFIRRRTFSRE